MFAGTCSRSLFSHASGSHSQTGRSIRGEGVQVIGRRPSSPKIEALRQKAKALVEAGPADVAFREERAFDSLLHDVSNSQEELELQNEQLRTAQAALEDSRN